MDVLWKNLVYSVRMLLKRPSLTAVAIIAIALGIGANTAIFSVVNAVLLQPLPYDEPQQLVVGKQLVARLELHPDRRHAVEAAEVAAVGKGDAQVAHPPPECIARGGCTGSVHGRQDRRLNHWALRRGIQGSLVSG